MASNQTTLPNVSENEETLLTGVNENVYEDRSIAAELTKKDINRVAWRSMLLQASFNYERMQASGWLYGLLPALKKIHTNKRDLARAMKGHMGFFNTHPTIATGEETIEEEGWKLFHFILDVASGKKKTFSDQWGLHNQLAVFNPAPVT